MNRVRIISGQWRGRSIDFPSIDGLRPTHDRIRETLFNWLMKDIVGAVCFDAFAGSGALGFEALSRGASKVVFVDDSREAIHSLRDNARKLGATDCEFINGSFKQILPSFHNPVFDIVFLDPPFHQNLLSISLDQLIASGCLKENALIYLEAEISVDFDALSGKVQLVKHKRTKSLQYGVARYYSEPRI